MEITKKEAIDRCLKYIIENNVTRHQRASKDKDLLLHDLDHIEHCLKFIREMNLSDKEDYIDITGSNIVSDMLFAKIKKELK